MPPSWLATKAVKELQSARKAAAKFFGGIGSEERKQMAAAALREASGLERVSSSAARVWADLVAHCALQKGRSAANLTVYTSEASVAAQIAALGATTAASLLELSVQRVAEGTQLAQKDKDLVRAALRAALASPEVRDKSGPKAAIRALSWLVE